MSITTVTELNSLYQLIYERAQLAAQQNSIMLPLVTIRDRNMGLADSKYPVRGTVSVEQVQDGVANSNISTYGSTAGATITPVRRTATAQITDMAAKTDPFLNDDLATDLGTAIADKIDTDLQATFTNFTTDKGPGAGNTATLATFFAAVVALRNAKVNLSECAAVIHSAHWQDFANEVVTPASSNAASGTFATDILRNAYMGMLAGVPVYIGSNIATDGSGDAISAVFHKSSIVFDAREMFAIKPSQPVGTFSTRYDASIVYGVGVVRATWGMKYTADAS